MAAAAVALLAAAGIALPSVVERRLNRVAAGGPWPVSARARALHARAAVVDLHADTLLWRRDPLARSGRGHVDLPRLREGGVRLQVFSAVTRFPRGSGYARAGDGPDLITLLAVVQRWPPRTWGSLRERARYQAGRLEEAERDSGGGLRIVRTAADLRAVVQGSAVGGLLALEGAHAAEGGLRGLSELHAAGYRMLGLAHFFDNEAAGSAHGAARGGLTPLGAAMVRQAEQDGMVVDLAHASPSTFADVLALSRRPLVVSHAGVRGTCETPRNLDDGQLRALAARGGVVGIGFWDDVVCGREPRHLARAVSYAVKVAGPRAVALGSDFDGTVTVPFDASGLPALTEALLGEGLDEPTVLAVLGGNAARVLEASLPR